MSMLNSKDVSNNKSNLLKKAIAIILQIREINDNGLSLPEVVFGFDKPYEKPWLDRFTYCSIHIPNEAKVIIIDYYKEELNKLLNQL